MRQDIVATHGFGAMVDTSSWHGTRTFGRNTMVTMGIEHAQKYHVGCVLTVGRSSPRTARTPIPREPRDAEVQSAYRMYRYTEKSGLFAVPGLVTFLFLFLYFYVWTRTCKGRRENKPFYRWLFLRGFGCICCWYVYYVLDQKDILWYVIN